jgi:hypothetical protein
MLKDNFIYFRCRTILLVGDDSPHVDQVTDMNGRMDPQETDFMKVCILYGVATI